MENEILNLEKKYWAAMAGQDYETVKSLTNFPCIVAGKKGVRLVDEPAFRNMFQQGASKKLTVKGITGEQIQKGEDHAMIAYVIELDYEASVMKCVCTSTWLKQNGNWVCAMHTECDLEEK